MNDEAFVYQEDVKNPRSKSGKVKGGGKGTEDHEMMGCWNSIAG